MRRLFSLLWCSLWRNRKWPSIITGQIPDAVGQIGELLATRYGKRGGIAHSFETKDSNELVEFVSRYDPARDCIWLATLDGRTEASICIDGGAAQSGAQVRWFIVSDTLRDRNTARQLLATAVRYCRARGYKSVYVWTLEPLEKERLLYESAGFVLTAEQRVHQRDKTANERRRELPLG